MIKQIRNMAVVMGCLAGMTACQRDEVAPRYDAGERILFGTPMLSVESESRSTLQDALEAGDKFIAADLLMAPVVDSSTEFIKREIRFLAGL